MSAKPCCKKPVFILLHVNKEQGVVGTAASRFNRHSVATEVESNYQKALLTWNVGE